MNGSTLMSFAVSRLRPAAILPLLAVLVAASLAAGGEERPGVLEPRLKATFSAEAALPIVKVAFRAGESFRSGDRLVEFDSALAAVNLEAAEAVERAAASAFGAAEFLASRNQSTRMELEMAARELALARARLAAARRELAACVIAAPFDGRVAEVHLGDYEWAARGAPILTAVDDTVLQARFLLPESAFSLVRPGDRVEVSVPAVGGESEATLTRVGAVFDAASRTFDVWAELDNRAGSYRAGMNCLVRWRDSGRAR